MHEACIARCLHSNAPFVVERNGEMRREFCVWLVVVNVLWREAREREKEALKCVVNVLWREAREREKETLIVCGECVVERGKREKEALKCVVNVLWREV